MDIRDDVISRRMAIDALNRGIWGKEWDKVLAVKILEDLPTILRLDPERKNLDYEDLQE